MKPAVLCLLFLSACDGGPDLLMPEDVIGVFALDSVDGAPLPFVRDNATTFSSVLTLRSDGTFRLISDTQSCPNRFACANFNFQYIGTWVLKGRTLELTRSGEYGNFPPASILGNIEGNNIILCGDTNTSCSSRNVYSRIRLDRTDIRAVYLRPDSLFLPMGQRATVFASSVPYTPNLTIVVRDTNLAWLDAAGGVQALLPGKTWLVSTAPARADSTPRVIPAPTFNLQPDTLSIARDGFGYVVAGLAFGGFQSWTVAVRDSAVARIEPDPSVRIPRYIVTGMVPGTTWVVGEANVPQLNLVLRDSTRVHVR